MLKHHVTVTQGKDPYNTTQKALELLDPPDLKGKRVLLKPNASRLLPYTSGANTNPRVVEAVIDYCRDLGAREVAIGESPITGVKVTEVYEKTGIASMAAKKGVPLLDFDAEPYQIINIPRGKVVNRIKVTWHWADFDFIISIPVMKTHMHTKVTLSVKNMKGMLWRRQKVAFHQIHAPKTITGGAKELDMAISDMSTILYPDMAVIDGTIGMQGLGPGAGEPKGAGLVVAGHEALAADWIACRLMDIEPSEVPHLSFSAKDRGIDCGEIKCLPDDYLKFKTPFAKPPEKISFRYPGVKVHDKDSCSACQNTLYLFLERYHHKLGLNLDTDPTLHLALGKGVANLPKGTIYLGNCCCYMPEAENGIPISGCPPVASQIWDKLKPNS
ncbi:DUF362 domain-containing protein [Dethiosulfatarculus sandiegensis]|uniref:DUF362 domain-containing protein n=1 Tax=Dethiosulfatarculus sandiegensis TaxID=1429043 RepID=A0A0D2J6N1_9BACT|nr:DUF362 domain-containing protein [Dethiosulfatarculus sandiegensis]KIX13824.1 hypothetical protein X474_11005 [Dethiosulfatarculus sandiegensis]